MGVSGREPHGFQRCDLPGRTFGGSRKQKSQKGDKVILGRSEACEEGIYVHSTGFQTEADALADKFVFRQGRSRETSYARDYDRLMDLLRYEKEHGRSSGSWDRRFPSTMTRETQCSP